MSIDFNTARPQSATADEEFVGQEEASYWLRDHAEQWVPELFPQGRIDHAEGVLRVADISGRPPRKQGSCVVYLRGHHAGSWHEFDGDEGGGPISTVGERLRLSGDALFAEIRRMMGSRPTSPGTAPARSAKRDHSAEINHTLAHAIPISGTLGMTYLHARGITAIPACDDLLFNDNTTDWSTRTGKPALIAQFRYPNGEPTGGIHRIYLRDDGSWHDGKKMLGPVEGGLVMLAPIDIEGRLGVGEGIESTLAGMQIYDLPGWAAGSAGSMAQLGDFIAVHGAGRIKHLTIFADRGRGGEESAQCLARAAVGAQIEVVIRLPNGADDFADDLHKALPRSEITLPIEAASDAGNAAATNRGGRPRRETPGDPAAAHRDPTASKNPIRVDGGMLPYAAKMGAKRIVAAGLPVYQRVDQLVRIAKGPITIAIAHEKRTIEATRALAIGNVVMRSFLAQASSWERYDGRSNTCVPTNVTEDIAQLVLESAGDWPFPPLTAIVHTPVILRDNTFLLTRGYHPGTGLYYDPDDTEFPGLLANPTKDDAIAAVEALTHPIREIPFPKINGKTDFSVPLSAILSIVHRHAVACVPAHLFNAVQARTGKGLSSNYVSIIATGSPAPAIMATQNPEETEKSLVAMLRTGATLISIDNLVHPIGNSGVINQILTEPVLNPRVLGKTEIFTAQNRHVVLINGNQVRIEDDLVPKVLHARLDAETEHPELREFESEFPLVVARRERGALVVAALTILLWHRQQGCPAHGERMLGGFEDWDREIRAALIALDVGDPVAGQKALAGNDRKRSDNEKLLHAWFTETAKQETRPDRTAPLTAKALAELAAEMLPGFTDAVGTYVSATPRCPALHEITLQMFDDKRGNISAIRLGSALGRIKDQVFGGLRVEEAGGNQSRVMTWIVRQIEG